MLRPSPRSAALRAPPLRRAAACLALAAMLACAPAPGPRVTPRPDAGATAAGAERVADIPLAGSPSRGPADAPVVLVEFADFYCPVCRETAPAVERLLAAYPREVRHVFKHLPFVRPGASLRAALAGVAAHRQGRFWALHDVLLALPHEPLTWELLAPHVARLSLDAERFRADLADPETEARVAADVALAERLGVAGTPTFFANGHRVVGGQTFESLRAVVEAELRRLPPRSGLQPACRDCSRSRVSAERKLSSWSSHAQ